MTYKFIYIFALIVIIMCIGDKVIRYYNKPGRYRKQDPKWNGASHSTHPVYYRYYRKLVNC